MSLTSLILSSLLASQSISPSYYLTDKKQKKDTDFNRILDMYKNALGEYSLQLGYLEESKSKVVFDNNYGEDDDHNIKQHWDAPDHTFRFGRAFGPKRNYATVAMGFYGKAWFGEVAVYKELNEREEEDRKSILTFDLKGKKKSEEYRVTGSLGRQLWVSNYDSLSKLFWQVKLGASLEVNKFKTNAGEKLPDIPVFDFHVGAGLKYEHIRKVLDCPILGKLLYHIPEINEYSLGIGLDAAYLRTDITEVKANDGKHSFMGSFYFVISPQS
jgi:hypothetical protein